MGACHLPAAYYFLKKRLSWRDLDPSSLLTYYRYISLLVTSGFYFVGPPVAPMYLKAGAVVCLFLEARFFTRIYRENESAGARKLLIFIETLGLASILVITGGLDSPFIWYAINPILLSATLGQVLSFL
jgi:NarL family two-component system sensor histidine kinase LiaS